MFSLLGTVSKTFKQVLRAQNNQVVCAQNVTERRSYRSGPEEPYGDKELGTWKRRPFKEITTANEREESVTTEEEEQAKPWQDPVESRVQVKSAGEEEQLNLEESDKSLPPPSSDLAEPQETMSFDSSDAWRDPIAARVLIANPEGEELEEDHNVPVLEKELKRNETEQYTQDTRRNDYSNLK